jgi:hypothetical protein
MKDYPQVLQIVVMMDCKDISKAALLQEEGVQIHAATGYQEYAAFNKGMQLIKSDLAFLLRDDDMPSDNTLWVSHFARIMANNNRLGMATCIGTILEQFQPFERDAWVGWRNRVYTDIASGDACCGEIHCGQAPTKLFMNHNKNITEFNEQLELGWKKTRFVYLPPRHASGWVVRKGAWAEIKGGFKPYHEPDLRPDWEIEFQHKLWAAGYAVGATDCNPFVPRTRHILDSKCIFQQTAEETVIHENTPTNAERCTEKNWPKHVWMPSKRYLESRGPFQPPSASNRNDAVPMSPLALWKVGPHVCG